MSLGLNKIATEAYESFVKRITWVSPRVIKLNFIEFNWVNKFRVSKTNAEYNLSIAFDIVRVTVKNISIEGKVILLKNIIVLNADLFLSSSVEIKEPSTQYRSLVTAFILHKKSMVEEISLLMTNIVVIFDCL